jgi:hypothetical protein
LRGRFRNHPERLFTELMRLSDDRDAACAGAAQPTDPTIVFAKRVAHRLQAGVLPFADRLTLLGSAMRSGIDRAEANLIILSVQEKLHCPLDPASRKSPVAFFALLITLIEFALAVIAWQNLVN